MCSPSNYEGVFEEIRRAGFQVAVFGDTIFDFGFKLGSHVIDLRSTKREAQSVIPYLLHYSKGLVTTHSGPAPLAWSFGKPVLVTNCIHIDYFVLAAAKGSFYLPKTWVDKNGEIVPLRKVYGTRLGHWGWSQSHSLLNGATLRENSPTELSNSTRHFLHSIKYGAQRD
jgi:putative glycosyltransferase (TIGR04372 family)